MRYDEHLDETDTTELESNLDDVIEKRNNRDLTDAEWSYELGAHSKGVVVVLEKDGSAPTKVTSDFHEAAFDTGFVVSATSVSETLGHTRIFLRKMADEFDTGEPLFRPTARIDLDHDIDAGELVRELEDVETAEDAAEWIGRPLSCWPSQTRDEAVYSRIDLDEDDVPPGWEIGENSELHTYLVKA